ncbi:hypothetical protein Syn7803C17_101 [Synechococcus phage ACG-2014f]|uniref:Uncharacterized protein n=1 Tax=Synechococcus phage ACG-2014f TaxID=1493511 RepID=A0A0E3HL04_9CAUD|nr:hypothetical protein Syn7803US40_103 [Synechococcus phage ACG-2014f]AIX31734.1 hypothetical protein Syn7803US42_106 [Synechococcus phage ACG-2014f]AIX33087.1 hypothetical protein Syn7803US50_103 [Synechococcus phage ACG-2014f]AIX33371.1 hypothetical protein Syn7803US52_99 [Synechococcus phage ACG-2014f]AIX42605.1 hypothetical protein Syn7803C17_101 [Synechococcus phage ACG-2014f]
MKTFRYSSTDLNQGMANLLISLEHGVAADRVQVNPIEVGTPVVSYVTDTTRRGTHVIVGFARGTTTEANPWGTEGLKTVYQVAWVAEAVRFIPEAVVPIVSTTRANEEMAQALMVAALAPRY